MTARAATLAVLLLLALAGTGRPAAAQVNYYSGDAAPPAPAGDGGGEVPAAKSAVVTSLQKCYAQLGREEALEVQMNYIKPYQECQRRLARKLKEKQQAAAGEKAAAAPRDAAPAAAGGFYRVKKTDPKEKEVKDGKDSKDSGKD